MRLAPTPAPPSAERLAFLEGTRGILALYVATGHVFTMVDPSAVTGRPSTAPPWFQWLAAPFLYGHVAVAMFIVVSGFSLQLGLLQNGGSGEVRSASGFLKRRAWRILPGYYACLLLSVVVATTVTPRYPYPPFTLYLPVDRATVLSHVFLVHNLWPGWMLKINGVLWTIAAEAQLYLAFPVLAALQARRGRGVALLLGVVFGLVVNELLVRLVPHEVFPAASYLRLWFAFLFVVGMAAAHVVYRPPLRGRRIEAWLGAFGWLGLFLGRSARRSRRRTTTRPPTCRSASRSLASAPWARWAEGGGRSASSARALSRRSAPSATRSISCTTPSCNSCTPSDRRESWARARSWRGWGSSACPRWSAGRGSSRCRSNDPFLRRLRNSRVPRARRTVPGSLPLPGHP